MAVEVGQVAPDFTLFDEQRKQRKLSEFRGKNTVLAFFPGAFTGVCNKESCALRDSSEKLGALNAQVVGITVDSPIANKAWIDHNKLNFSVLSDFNREVVKLYDVTFTGLAGIEGYVSANRAVFVLDKNGVARYRWVGQPGIEPNYDEINQALSRLST